MRVAILYRVSYEVNSLTIDSADERLVSRTRQASKQQQGIRLTSVKMGGTKLGFIFSRESLSQSSLHLSQTSLILPPEVPTFSL